jgi:DNA-binding NtrC family response regulator
MSLDAPLATRSDASSPDALDSEERVPPIPFGVFSTVGMVGDSPAMRHLRAEVLCYARTSAPVLVRGETGSGKELVARALHLASRRASAPFVAVNVATLRRDLLASELFGHERGAFTGAVTRHRGLFDQADHGTLFLDELGELNLSVQADLLRVLETGEVRSVGGERSRVVDVRVVAATHRHLGTLVAEGRFRADLYYRLHVLPVNVPPLRERKEDLPALAEQLLARLRPEVGTRCLTPGALGLLRKYDWPGNIRQLFNVLRRATARVDTMVLGADVMREALRVELCDVQPGGRYAPLTHAMIAEALLKSEGRVAGAARVLGVPRSTLRDRLRAYGREASTDDAPSEEESSASLVTEP